MALKFTGGGASHDEDGIPYYIGRKNFGNGVSINNDFLDYLKKQQDRIDKLEEKLK
jgi:hypothetical protein